jgi:hypothetical protein
MSRMIVQYREISRSNHTNKDKYSNRRHNKGAITCAIKAVVKKSILMQITKARAANSFH